MQSPFADERILLEGGTLRLSLRSTAPLLRCELRDGGGATAKVAPALKLGEQYSAAVDLGSLADGQYTIHFKASDGTLHAFGRPIAERQLALAGPRREERRHGAGRKIATSTFARAGGKAHVWVYADPSGPDLRVRVSNADDIDVFLGRATNEAPAASSTKAIRYSIISAVYNVEKYLDEFFTSITKQTLDFKSHIELIMVDDGSTDRSAKIIKRWRNKYPNIQYFHKENGGVSSARNLGLAHASHEWVTFIDPDDFVDREYFSHVDAAIRKHHEIPVALISCHLVFHYEGTFKGSDAHPLNYRYERGETIVPANKLGRHIQLNVNSAFLRRSMLSAAGLTFDERVRPTFEDAHLIGRLLFTAPDAFVVFLPQAEYFYRKRADQSSLVDNAKFHPGWYGDQLRYGCLDLLRRTSTAGAPAPRHVQDTVLYELSWRFGHVVGRPEMVSFLGDEGREQFRLLLKEIFALIETRTIMEYDITSMPSFFRVGILNLFKDTAPPEQTVEITGFDGAKNLVRCVYWTREPQPSEAFRSGEAVITPSSGKMRRIDFLGSPFVFEHIRWLPLYGNRPVRVSIGKREARFEIAGRPFPDGVSLTDVRAALAPRRLPEALMPQSVRDLRRAAASPAATEAFRNAWVFLDRDTEADDSAEFLYRYVRERSPETNAFFILRRGSPHWDRLSADGFRLLGFHEPEHAIALLNATHLISSQADHYVVGYLDEHHFGDMLNFRFVFLQHGIIRDDISNWLNQIRIDCLVTSTNAEYESIVGDGTAYKFTDKEVVLTGLPRHDTLLNGPRSDGKTVVVMPTWRQTLTGMAEGPGRERAKNRAFYQSEFAERWRSLLHSQRLADAVESAGYRLVFVPHPHLEPYVDFLCPRDRFEVKRFGSREPIQPIFREMSLFVTDFTSKAFDAAYLDKSVIYYQFDSEYFFGSGQVSRLGYFDYQRDGFGPVHREEGAVLDAIEAHLIGIPPDPVYRERAARTFAFRDGRCCERVFAAIMALNRPPTT